MAAVTTSTRSRAQQQTARQLHERLSNQFPELTAEDVDQVMRDCQVLNELPEALNSTAEVSAPARDRYRRA